MSMSTHVVGFRPPDEKWEKMKAIWDACADAGITVPEEVEAFFNGGPPDAAGVRIELEETTAVKEWSDECGSGFEVDVRELPAYVTIIRFYNSDNSW